MAVRLNSSQLTRSANVPAGNAFTLMGWARQSAVNANYSIIGIHGANADLEYSLDGTTLTVWANGDSNVAFSSSPSLGETFAWAVTGNGSTATGYWRSANSNSWITATSSYTVGASTTIEFGDTGTGGIYYFNGRLWNIKVWDRVLTSEELLIESFYESVKFPTSLNLRWPLYNASDTADRSGNGRNPTASGTALATEDTTWQPWKPGAYVLTPTSSGVTGTFASTLGAVAAAFSGAITNNGTFASTLGAVVGAFSGTVGSAPTGTFASTLGAVSANFAGTVTNLGTFASTLGSVQANFSGQVTNLGTFASILGSVQANFSGVVGDAVSGTFASTLGSVQADFSGSVIAPNVTGTFASTLGGVVASFSGNVAGGGGTNRFRTQIGAGQ